MRKKNPIPAKYIRRQRIAVLVLIVLVAAFAAVVTVIVKSVSNISKPVMADPGPATVEYMKLYFNRYKNENFISKNGWKYYTQDGDILSTVGIDVSYAQKDIDWNKVKAAGIDYAMIRLGFRGYESGNLNLDEYFHKNIAAAQAAGVETGVYFFSQAVNVQEAEEEADFVIDKLKNYNITYPVAFDWEVISGESARTDNIPQDVLNSCAAAFCDKIKQAGYKPVIYASLNLLRSHFEKYKTETVFDYDFWLAEYKDHPEYPYYFKMWQYTDEGVVDGIEQPVDINVFFNIDRSTH